MALDGTTWETQVTPPSVVARISALGWPTWMPVVPTATQFVAVAQLTEESGPLLEGSARGVQVVPPSVVVMAAPVEKSGLDPTATHVVADGQLIPNSGPAPAGVVCGVQVVPPSVVATTSGTRATAGLAPRPTARHFVADEQDRSPMSPSSAGMVLVFQVAPPSEVTSRVEPLLPSPRAKQSVVVGQLTR